MKSSQKMEIETTLILDHKETLWLKGKMQNPLNGAPEDEENQDKEMRSRFWKALSPKDRS